MIKVTRLDDSPLVINAGLIEFVEAVPETIVCLTTGKKIMVKETIDDIIDLSLIHISEPTRPY